MAPSHEEWKGKVELKADDNKAIQALYGNPGEPRPPGPPFNPGGIPPFHPSHGFPGEGGPPFRGGPPPVYPGQEGPVIVINPDRRTNSIPRDEPRRQLQKPNRSKNEKRTFDLDDDNDDNVVEFFDDVDSVIENNVDQFSDDIDGKRPSIRKINQELCNGGGVDTMVTLKNDDSYVFKGKKFWKLT